jgi:hypothetical protein
LVFWSIYLFKLQITIRFIIFYKIQCPFFLYTFDLYPYNIHNLVIFYSNKKIEKLKSCKNNISSSNFQHLQKKNSINPNFSQYFSYFCVNFFFWSPRWSPNGKLRFYIQFFYLLKKIPIPLIIIISTCIICCFPYLKQYCRLSITQFYHHSYCLLFSNLGSFQKQNISK